MKTKSTVYDLIFDICNWSLLALCGAITLLPFLNVLAKSLSGNSAVASGSVGLLPVEPQIAMFRHVLFETGFPRAFFNSVFITSLGVALAVVFTALVAYPLSKSWLRGRKVLLGLYVLSMVLAPGIVPRYLLMRYLGILNTYWVLIIPYILSVYNMILVKNYFEGLPEELEESARIDGASNLLVLFRIVIPVAKPILATVAIFYAVGYWNNYFSAMMFITKPAMKPLQLFLLELIRQAEAPANEGINIDAQMNILPETVRAASIVLTTLPILAVYPALQKHFVKGITVGSVKG